MSETNWKDQLAKLRGSAAPPKEKKQDVQKGKGKGQGKKPYHKKSPGGRKPNQPRHGDGGGDRRDDDYFLPADTRSIILPQLGLTRQKVDNFALLLNKCALFDKRQKKFMLSRKADRRKGIETYSLMPNFHPANVEQIAARHAKAIDQLGIEYEKLDPLTVDWRLVIGLGTESVYEPP